MPENILCSCCRLLAAFFFKINFLRNISGTLSQYKATRIQIRIDSLSVMIWAKTWGPNSLQRYQQTTKEAASLKRVKEKKIDKYKTIFTFFKFLHSSVFPSLQIFSTVWLRMRFHSREQWEIYSPKPPIEQKLNNSGLQTRVRCGILFSLFLIQNICYGYSKEPSPWDGSLEHPKHMFKLMVKKIITILRS